MAGFGVRKLIGNLIFARSLLGNDFGSVLALVSRGEVPGICFILAARYTLSPVAVVLLVAHRRVCLQTLAFCALRCAFPHSSLGYRAPAPETHASYLPASATLRLENNSLLSDNHSLT